MFLTNLFDFLVSKHAALANRLVFILIVLTSLRLLFGAVWLLLLHFEGCLTGPILSEIIRGRIACLQSLRSLIRLRHRDLVSIGQSLLPLLGVLPSSEAARACNFADLVIYFVDIRVLLQLIDSSHKGNFPHNDDLLEEIIDQALLHPGVLVG